MKNEWPVKAQALGGRHYKVSPEGVAYVDQNFDTYSVEYTYSDGTKFFFRRALHERMRGDLHELPARHQGIGNRFQAAAIAGCRRACTRVRRRPRDLIWESKVSPDEKDPYQNEWNDLVDAIRDDKPYNEVKRGVEASLVSSMGRMAANTGREITFDQMLNCEHEMAPDVDKFTMDSPAPLVADANGRYPVPQPGIVTTREY